MPACLNSAFATSPTITWFTPVNTRSFGARSTAGMSSKTARTIHPGSNEPGRLRNRCCDARDCARPNRRAGRHPSNPRTPCRQSRSRVEESQPAVTARRPMGLETPLETLLEPPGFSCGKVQRTNDIKNRHNMRF
jgi:hypothetical protein